LMRLSIFIVVVTISPDRCVKNTHWPWKNFQYSIITFLKSSWRKKSVINESRLSLTSDE